jgi:hypothetical protein
VLAAGEDNFCSLCEPADTSSNGGELFDARTGTWSVTGSMIDPQGRPGHAGVLLLNGSLLAAGGGNGARLSSAELYTPPATAALPTSCTVSVRRTDSSGHSVVRVAVRDIASGVQSTKVLQATNVRVTLPKFPAGSRDPAVVTATKINQSQSSGLSLTVTTRAGKTVICNPF